MPHSSLHAQFLYHRSRSMKVGLSILADPTLTR